MTTGCVIFAYNGDLDYGSQAVLAAKLVRKHLNLPVTLITDTNTLDSTDVSVFDGLVVNAVDTDNTRILDGKKIAFKNTNRSSAFDLSPYDRTLIIDSDFLVLSKKLKPYIDSSCDFMICANMQDLHPTRLGSRVVLDPASIPMLWATNIIFNKTAEVKTLFDLVDHIKDNWVYYGALYKFDTRRFRNDYAFSIACHTLSGFGINQFHRELPSPLLFNDRDKLVNIKSNNLTWLLQDDVLVKCNNQDIHYMNKFDLANNYNSLMELADD